MARAVLEPSTETGERDSSIYRVAEEISGAWRGNDIAASEVDRDAIRARIANPISDTTTDAGSAVRSSADHDVREKGIKERLPMPLQLVTHSTASETTRFFSAGANGFEWLFARGSRASRGAATIDW